MRRASLNLWQYGGLGSVLIALVIFALFRNHRPHSPAITTAMVSSSGPIVNDFFEGTKPDSRYSLRRIQAVRRAMPVCGAKRSSFLPHLFQIQTVYASCPPSDCTGDGWKDFTDECNTGGPCSGTYNNTEDDPLSTDGFFDPGSHCGSIPECGCVTITCPN